ncbi:MAG: hypothetical protein JWM59_342 [Verrucomicrobiales bacterium]|nr:hypothetical protein [Verrucomicrobiales bacterium]
MAINLHVPRCARLAGILICLHAGSDGNAKAAAPEKEKPAKSIPASRSAKAAAGNQEASPVPTAPTAAPSLEPVCATIEPSALRTELARSFGGAKKTVIVPAREDSVLGITTFSHAEFDRAGLDQDRFLAQATAAATRLLLSLKPEITAKKDGTPAYATLRSDRPFTPSVVLSPQFLPLFEPQFGDRLVVLMPNRNIVYIFSRNFGGFQEFGPRILKEYAAALYPCSTEAFEVGHDGVKCLGAFDDGEDVSPSAPDRSPTAKEDRSSNAPSKADQKIRNKSKPK